MAFVQLFQGFFEKPTLHIKFDIGYPIEWILLSNCLHSNCRFLLFYTQIVADFGFDLPKVVSSVNQCELMSTSIDHKRGLHIDLIDFIYIYMIYITFQYLKLETSLSQ